MIVSDKIYFDLDKERVSPDIFKLLTYPNPDYFQKANMGLSVWGVPEFINTFALKGRVIEIMRGEALKIKPHQWALGNWSPDFQHPDHPVKLQYINNDFLLDDLQERAIEALKGNRQGVVHAVTSAGKSLIILKACVEIGQRSLVVVHRKVLMQQLLEDIKKYIRDEHGNEITPGVIGNGKLTLGPITIAIDKTLGNNLERYREEFGTVFLDECHLVSADTLFSLLNGINSRNRFGVSGTLKRKDQKDFLIFAAFGPVIASIGKDELLELGRVVPVHPVIWESETKFDWDSVVIGLEEQGEKNATVKARAMQEATIAGDPGRNAMILAGVARLKGKTIVLSRYVKPCYELQEALLARYGIKAGIITGKDSKGALEAYEAMKHGDMQVIFATVGCVSTGLSISDLDNLVLISPIYNNELLLHQIRGRLMRTAPGKTHGTLYFVYDPYIFPEHKLRKMIRIIKE